MPNDALPRIGYLHLPTPLECLDNLAGAVGAPCPLLVKRDDTTTVGLGGNKTRKLEYVCAQAKAEGADVLITTGGVQSNHCRQTAAYAAKLGMACHLVLSGEADCAHQGNVLLFDLYGAQLHFQPDEDQCDADCRALVEQLRSEGLHPHYIVAGASTAYGAAAYAECADEIMSQAADAGVQISDVFLPTGTGGTQSGLILGFHGSGVRVHGVSVSADEAKMKGRLRRICAETCAAFPGRYAWAESDLLVTDRFVGPGYAIPDDRGNAAIRLLGRTEALTLDPVYTGKAMAGMLDWLRSPDAADATGVVFLHTGGSPAIFSYADALVPCLRGE